MRNTLSHARTRTDTERWAALSHRYRLTIKRHILHAWVQRLTTVRRRPHFNKCAQTDYERHIAHTGAKTGHRNNDSVFSFMYRCYDWSQKQ